MSLFSSIWADVKRQFQYGNMVTKIIIVNVVIFLLVNLIKFGMFATGMESQALAATFYNMMRWVAMPMDFGELIFKPWTLVSYMFLHEGFWHLLWNMVFMYWFGTILQDFLGNKKILPVYFYGGVAGAVLALLAVTFLPNLASAGKAPILLGASAGVSAVLMAAATLTPDYTIQLIFLGPVRIKYIALLRIVLDLIAIPTFVNVGGSIAHLGGVGFGYLFITQMQNGNDWSTGFNVVMDRLAGFFQSFGRRGPRVAYKNEQPAKLRKVRVKQGSRDTRYNDSENSVDTQARVDSILDKINKSGYESLTKEEKEFLFRYSRQ